MINSKATEKLKKIVEFYKDSIFIPSKDHWKTMDDNELWTAIVSQVVVVGNSAPDAAVRLQIKTHDNWYAELLKQKPPERQTEIHKVLRSSGVRYVSKNPSKCRKTSALVKNLALVESSGGPKEYIASIAKIVEENRRISAIIDDMSFIKNKGARDFLIELGIVENAIAFDVRVQKVLAACGVELPADLANNKTAYKELEAELLEKVCAPTQVSGSVLDRILYQKYSELV